MSDPTPPPEKPPHPLKGRATGPRPDIAEGLRDYRAAARERSRERARRTAEHVRLRKGALAQVNRLVGEVAALDEADLRALDAALALVDGDRYAERDLGILPEAGPTLRHFVRAVLDLKTETGVAQRRYRRHNLVR